MAFDFKGGGASAPRPNNTSTGSGSNYPSSLNNIPRPGGSNPSSIPKPADTSATRNAGFQNRPEVKRGGGITPPAVTPDNGKKNNWTQTPIDQTAFIGHREYTDSFRTVIYNSGHCCSDHLFMGISRSNLSIFNASINLGDHSTDYYFFN